MTEPCPACRDLIDALDKRVFQALKDRDERVRVTAELLNQRLHDSNSMASKLLDAVKDTTTRREHDELIKRVAAVENSAARIGGGAQGISTVVIVIGWVITTGIAIVAASALFIHPR